MMITTGAIISAFEDGVSRAEALVAARDRGRGGLGGDATMGEDKGHSARDDARDRPQDPSSKNSSHDKGGSTKNPSSLTEQHVSGVSSIECNKLIQNL